MEPRSKRARLHVRRASLEDLVLVKYLEVALEEVKERFEGPWFLPRVTNEKDNRGDEEELKRREKRKVSSPGLSRDNAIVKAELGADDAQLPKACDYFHNSMSTTLSICLGSNDQKISIPPKSTFLQGDISDTLDAFENYAPQFDIVILDPPWPNRSARRKRSYSTSSDKTEMHFLLCSIPLEDYLTENGYVAVWITNKPSFRDMILAAGGLFERWGVQLLEEWIWLKVTINGDPICALDATWRKPYEVLLVGRRGVNKGDIKRRVIVGVPDLHSRKPNLKVLFESLSGIKHEYEGLEIFARNLTAGWWSWGNEVLKFQASEHWAPQPL